VTTIPAALARDYWRALLGNATSLIEDAALLLDQSPARARSLLILAQEELGKAQRLYDLASHAWSSQAATVDLPPSFTEMERWHNPKIVASLEQAAELPAFWGDYSSLAAMPSLDATAEEWDAHIAEVEAGHRKSAHAINLQKQAGFYVDRDGDSIRSPQEVEVPTIVEEVMRTAGVAEMMLISDHTRMQDDDGPYDPTHDLQQRLLPFSHPEML
jgi:AbiV family abortive infection protein